MNCEAFERLLAEALGDELAVTDEPAFAAHLAECGRCRRDYESARQTVTALKKLPTPPAVSIRREGDRLVIGGPVRVTAAAAWWARPVFRYAAAVLFAFLAGYAAHAQRAPDPARRTAEVQIVEGHRGGESIDEHLFQASLVNAYRRHPNRSGFAACLAALFSEQQ